ncbi:putative RING-H2 finger protein ATL21A [Henckelia pumila]|uniref:putative RING-H2 finger protein ATL21A n=1 Tax=Henckelia pumila TaxID=405737 RepID=UPI003C6E54C2
MATQTLFLFLFLSVVHAQNDCPTSYCYTAGLSIRFPFWLKGQLPPQKCSLPGFDLSCIDRKTYLNIPYSGGFYVDSIYYSLKLITLSDPGNCLARRLLSLNLSSSPFKANSYENYTLYSCPRSRASSIGVIDCLSNSSTAIVALNVYRTFYFQDVSMCKKIITVPVPSYVSFLPTYEFPVTIDLTWIAPDTSGTGAGAAHGRTYVFLVPLLAISVLILFISCCVCMRRRDESWYSGTQTNRGLDESTIETYRKMTISENRLIPGSNDITCAICLEDYVRNDTLRFMPGCEHCFHVECIDKWLRMNRRCPICRVDL